MYLDGNVPCIASNVWHIYFSEEAYITVNFDPGSTATVAVTLAVLLLVTIFAVAIVVGVVGLLLQKGRRNRRDQKTVTVGIEYVTNVPLRTNGYPTHDGVDRDSFLEDGVRLGSGDESEMEGTKNSQAVDI